MTSSIFLCYNCTRATKSSPKVDLFMYLALLFLTCRADTAAGGDAIGLWCSYKNT